MRLVPFGSRLGGSWDITDEILQQLLKQAGEVRERGQLQQQPAGQAALESGEPIGAVDLVDAGSVAVTADRFGGGGVDSQGVEIVAEDLGAEVLLRGEPRDAGQLLQSEAMLDAFEGLLDTPAGVYRSANSAAGCAASSSSEVITTCRLPLGVTTRINRTMLG